MLLRLSFNYNFYCYLRYMYSYAGYNISENCPRPIWPSYLHFPRPIQIDLGLFGWDRIKRAQFYLGQHGREVSIYLGQINFTRPMAEGRALCYTLYMHIFKHRFMNALYLKGVHKLHNVVLCIGGPAPSVKNQWNGIVVSSDVIDWLDIAKSARLQVAQNTCWG